MPDTTDTDSIMNSESETPGTEKPRVSFPNKNFAEWLKSKNQASEKLISVGVLAVELLLVYFSSTQNFSIMITMVINLIFLVYFIYEFNNHYKHHFTTRDFTKLTEFNNHPDLNQFKFWKFEERANNSISQFRAFEGFLYSTAILYVVLILLKIEGYVYSHEGGFPNFQILQSVIRYGANLLIHLLSYAGAIFILKCFYVMYFPTFNDTEMQKSLNTVKYFWFGLILIMAVEAIFTLPIKALVPNFQLNSFYFELICSVVSAFALMLLFARFESRHLGIHPAVNFILYIYAILQVSLPFITENISNLFFTDNNHIFVNSNYNFFVTIILIVCLIGKLVFYNIVVYLYQTKRLFYYFIKTAINYEKEDEYWLHFENHTFIK